MTNKEITQKSLKQVKDLLDDVQAMTGKEFMKILDSMAQFHEYSFSNQMILCFHGCSQVAGYKKWQELERRVKKGAKAVWILAPYLRKEKVKVKNVEGTEEEKEKKIVKGFYSVPIFDIRDTEGKEIKRGITTKARLSFSQVKDFAEKSGFTVELSPMKISMGGGIRDHTIGINSNLSEAENTGTLIHELTHGFLNHSNGNGKAISSTLKEQQAETATYLACKALGIERKSEFYLKSWGLSENILKDFQKLDKVARKIIQGLIKQEEGKNG